jgi:hypothetical protein
VEDNEPTRDKQTSELSWPEYPMTGFVAGLAEHLPAYELPLESYDSKIERIFYDAFCKVAHEHIVIEPQSECLNGRFILDFRVYAPECLYAVGIECDGREYHNETRDCVRDRAILESAVVGRIVRIPGKDIMYRIHDVLQMIASCEYRLFSDAKIVNVHTLATRERMREDSWQKSPGGLYLYQDRHYERPDEDQAIYYDPERYELTPTRLLWAGRPEI